MILFACDYGHFKVIETQITLFDINLGFRLKKNIAVK